MTYPQKVNQLALQDLLAKVPTTTAPNGVPNPPPHPSIGVFVRW
jgi:hypothetical protein